MVATDPGTPGKYFEKVSENLRKSGKNLE